MESLGIQQASAPAGPMSQSPPGHSDRARQGTAPGRFDQAIERARDSLAAALLHLCFCSFFLLNKYQFNIY
jgi:hypothetical protein